MLLLSLVGHQPIPNLLGVRFLQPEQNLLVYTSETEQITCRLRRLISGSSDLSGDLRIADPYPVDRILSAIENRLPQGEQVVFNFTGGTKPMAWAGFMLAARRSERAVYLQSEGHRSLLYEYLFTGGQPALQPPVELPPLITIDDYLKSFLNAYMVEGCSMEEGSDRLSAGGLFERAVYNALHSRGVEALSGVRPSGGGRQVEIDLVMRMGNQVGIAEVKTGGNEETAKHALDQLKMACEQTYLGTYTVQFLIVAAPAINERAAELARERRVRVICLPGYRAGQPLMRQEAERLYEQIQAGLLPTANPRRR